MSSNLVKNNLHEAIKVWVCSIIKKVKKTMNKIN